MSETRYTPEEFARLLSLPEDHPERVQAEASPAFEVRRRLHDEFVAPGDVLLSADELKGAELELARRMAGVSGAGSTAAASFAPARGGDSPRTGHDASAAAEGPARILSIGDGASDADTGPSRSRRPRRAPMWLAAAAVVVAMSAIGWWTLGRGPAQRTVRGEPPVPGVFVIAQPVRVPDGLELSWTPVAGADAYRVVVYGSGLREIARFDALPEPKLVLRAQALPGTSAGSEVQVEVTALRGGDPLGTSPMRSVRLP